MSTRFKQRTLCALATASGLLMIAAPAGSAYEGDAYGDGSDSIRSSWDGYSRDEPRRAVSYINADTGAATQNDNIDPNSSCFDPDRYDEYQKLSDPNTANRNVHNDACFFGSRYSDTKVDGPASFDSRGVGYISACPDPDGAGPKFAFTRDRTGDGKADFCFQSGYQEKGMAGDKVFHARMNNFSTTGTQSVRWCYDADRNGCSDEDVRDRIAINWAH